MQLLCDVPLPLPTWSSHSQGAIHEDAAGGIDADLLVELEMREWELHGLPHLLLLDVHASDVRVHHIWLLV